MCATCGCNDASSVSFDHLHGKKICLIADRDHLHRHHGIAKNSHVHDGQHTKSVVEVEQDVLYENNLLAEKNREHFLRKNLLALNLVSSPGSGKTMLLEKTLQRIGDELKCYVIEGDQQTSNDAKRIHATGTPVVQINTGKGCHLDAHMVFHAVEHLNPENDSVVFIENVGNLVCPAMFDLGEGVRVVIASVTEGDDKPAKYPDMFFSSQVCVINKIDLLPYVPFDVEKFKTSALQINPLLKFIKVSALKETGLEDWCKWLRHHVPHPQLV